MEIPILVRQHLYTENDPDKKKVNNNWYQKYWMNMRTSYQYRKSHCGDKTINTLRPRQNDHLFADDTFKCIFLNENIRISIKISQKFVLKGLINNILALVLIMAWRRPGDKPLSEPMMAVRSLMHICVTQPQWVKNLHDLLDGNIYIERMS